MQDGLYNQYRLAVAPNGSTSYINDSTASLHPIINRVEERQEKMIGKILLPCPISFKRHDALLSFSLRYGYAKGY